MSDDIEDEESEEEARVRSILGEEDDWTKASELWFAHLGRTLRLPCDVVGIEDFRWEARYVMGTDDPAEYKRLCRRQPSYEDLFSLEAIEPDAGESEWAMHLDDIGARVRRKKDGKDFLLGLSELTPADERSENAQPMQDYTFWFCNYR